MGLIAYDAGGPNQRQVTYAYDLVGNRLTEVETSATPTNLTYAYDAINRLLTITDNLDPTQNVAYTYDANGNTTSKTKAGITTEFVYDIRDQLGEVRQGGAVPGRYGYDYDGRRIVKIGNDGRRHYTYDQLSVITEADETNATVSKYEYGPDQLVSLNNRNEGRSFFHLDILGSTVNLSDPSGAARQSILYDAWGIERERLGTSANRFTFTGQEKDEETGLYYFKARFYDPDIGRFLSQDAMLGDVYEPPSLHRFGYVRGNPARFTDLTGRQAEQTGSASGEGTLVRLVDRFFEKTTQMRVPTEFEIELWSLLRQLAGGQSLEDLARERAIKSAPPGDTTGPIILMDEEEAKKIQETRRMAEEAFKLGQTIDETRRALDAAQQENLRDSSPRVVGETETGARLEPLANLDPESGAPHSGVILDDPFGHETTQRARIAEEMARAGELTIQRPTGRGSQNPRTREAQEFGVVLHQDRPGALPDQLRERFPETEFRFAKQGEKGQDVEVVGGKHPSEYPNSTWPKGVDFADFKPDTATGKKTFERDQRVKWKEKTHMLTYDPKTGKLRPSRNDDSK